MYSLSLEKYAVSCYLASLLSRCFMPYILDNFFYLKHQQYYRILLKLFYDHVDNSKANVIITCSIINKCKCVQRINTAIWTFKMPCLLYYKLFAILRCLYVARWIWISCKCVFPTLINLTDLQKTLYLYTACPTSNFRPITTYGKHLHLKLIQIIFNVSSLLASSFQ